MKIKIKLSTILIISALFFSLTSMQVLANESENKVRVDNQLDSEKVLQSFLDDPINYNY